MIPFFRKIRWRLAADNQFFKYSRYAIGEIVLVVIGILIALQVNNWNEERKNRAKKLTFLKSLIEDLKKDTTQLNYQINSLNERIKYSDEFILKMEKSDANVDTITNLWFTRRNYLPIDFYPNKSTVESLYSTGNIELFDSEEISRLTAFYNSMEIEYSLIRFRMQQISNANVELGDKFGWLWKQNKDSHIYKLLREDFDEKEFLRLLDLAIHKDNQAIKNNKDSAADILKGTDSLLESLSHQIE